MQRVKRFAFLFFPLISLACQLSAVGGGVPSSPALPPAGEGIEYVADVITVPQYQSCEVTAREFLNVRGGPSVSWSVDRQLKHGDKVTVTDWEKGWAMIGAAEWVNGDYLKCQ